MEKNAEKWRKEKNTEVQKVHDYFSPIFLLLLLLLLLLHFSSTAEVRARMGVVSGWERPEKGVGREEQVKTASFWPVFFFKRNRLQNDVVLACSFKIEMAKTTPFWTHKINKNIRAQHSPLQPDGGRRRRRRRKRKRAYLVRGERLARLSGAFVKGHRLPSGETPEGGVAPP